MNAKPTSRTSTRPSTAAEAVEPPEISDASLGDDPGSTDPDAGSGSTSGSTTAPNTPVAGFFVFIGSVIAAAGMAFANTIGDAIAFLERWIFNGKKALYGIAVTRIVFGLTAFGLLASNFATRLYTFGTGSAWNGEIAEPVSDFPKIWLFSAFHAVAANDVAFTTLYLALMVLAVLFIIGWRFRIVLPVFFVMWIGFIEMNDMVGDQGDNMFRIAMILMFFTDAAARWSIDARRRAKSEWFAPGTSPNQIGTALHNLALVALTAQVAFVYGSGALYKAQGSPWAAGYAVYDPLQTARFGTWPILSDLITAWGPMVALGTWGSILLQSAFLLALLSRPTRLVALFGILGFHVMIGVLMGLPWFSLTMIAIDSIFIRDRSWKRLGQGVSRRWRTAMGRVGVGAR